MGMTPRIVTCELPPEVQAGHILDSYGIATGVIVVVARAGSKNATAPLLRDLVVATGSEPDPKAMPKAESTLTNIVLSRLLGHRVKQVLVTHSENLPAECLDLLAALSATAAARLTLLYGLDSGEAIRAWGARMLAPDVEWIAAENELPGKSQAENDRPIEDAFPEEIPWVDFPVFRSACRQLLNEADFAAMDATYRDAFQRTQANRPETTEAASTLLLSLLSGTDNGSRAITFVRAVQAACLTHGYLLKVDQSRLYLMVSEAQHRQINEVEILRLGDQPEPCRAAIPLLADAGLDDAEILSIRLTDVDRNGVLPGTRKPMHPASHALLRTQRILRFLEGAEPTDAFIENSNRVIKTALREAAKVGVPVDTSRATTAKGDRWQHQTGLHLQDIR